MDARDVARGFDIPPWIISDEEKRPRLFIVQRARGIWWSSGCERRWHRSRARRIAVALLDAMLGR